MTDYALAFIPVFVAIDVIGLLPIFISLTFSLSRDERIRVIRQSIFTALAAGLVFLFLGRFALKVLGVEINDFKVAGGILLLALSINDLIFGVKRKEEGRQSDVGIVPIGMPLIVGPAVLTTLLLLLDSYGIWPTIASLLMNLVLVYLVFRASGILIRILGEGGTRAVAKFMSILLAAIGVMMIRRGLGG
ncbi:MAG TPA: MarC family protein [Syntrophales bacterium]|nr:MarC family protein [Syntrophales bacterium]